MRKYKSTYNPEALILILNMLKNNIESRPIVSNLPLHHPWQDGGDNNEKTYWTACQFQIKRDRQLMRFKPRPFEELLEKFRNNK
jgi:hypothetical protein